MAASRSAVSAHPKTTVSLPRQARVESNEQVRRTGERLSILIEGVPPPNDSAWTPDLPGCVTTGDTVEEAEREMRAAIALHIEGIVEDGGEIPTPPALASTSSARPEPPRTLLFVALAGPADVGELRRWTERRRAILRTVGSS